jgi:hypothetical protein
MPKRVNSIAPTVSATLLAAVTALTTTGAVLAGDCIEQPSQQQLTQGTHWYYHWDRANKRKCWYREVVGTRTPEAVPPPDQSSDSVPTPTFSSLFSSLIEGLMGPTSAAAPQDTTIPPATRDPRLIQANPTKTLKIDDLVRKEQPSLPEERADQRYAPSLSRAKRDALFQEFLRWDENQRNVDVGAKRDTLFRKFLQWDEDPRNTSDVRPPARSP